MDAETLGLHVSIDRRLCLLSRYPILETRSMEREVFEHIGGAGVVTAYRLDLDGREAWLTNLHLETPRAGLELIRSGRLSAGADSVRQLSFLRDVELRSAATFVSELDGPRIVVGDFNTPVESRSYRTEWGDWSNAFSVAGEGFGWTRLTGRIGARIDHVLVDESWTVVDAWPGEDVGSDHLPMVARLRLR
jgi:vancomycin resistance protein VanJ